MDWEAAIALFVVVLAPLVLAWGIGSDTKGFLVQWMLGNPKKKKDDREK